MLDVRVIRAFAIDYPEVVRSINKFYLQETKTLLTADAKRRAPIKDGGLRKSIKGRVKGDVAIVYTNIEYGPYVEYGTSRQKAQPYMRPTIDENRRELVGRWRSLFRKTFRALGKL